MSIVVYCHTCTASGKKYVGQTKKTMMVRWREHTSHARWFAGCVALGRAIRKYGTECWTHEVLATVETQKEADSIEIKWIADLNTVTPNGYNIDRGGKSPVRPELGRKLRKAFYAKPASERRAQSEQLRTAYQDWLATTTPEQRSQLSREARNSLSPEKRSEIAKRGKANMTPEARKAAAVKGKANMTPEARRAVRANQIANTTPEQRSESARKGANSLTPEQQERRRQCGREMMAKLQAKRTPESEARRLAASYSGLAARRLNQEKSDKITKEQSAERSRKAWRTRRLKSALKLFDFTLISDKRPCPI